MNPVKQIEDRDVVTISVSTYQRLTSGRQWIATIPVVFLLMLVSFGGGWFVKVDFYKSTAAAMVVIPPQLALPQPSQTATEFIPPTSTPLPTQLPTQTPLPTATPRPFPTMVTRVDPLISLFLDNHPFKPRAGGRYQYNDEKTGKPTIGKFPGDDYCLAGRGFDMAGSHYFSCRSGARGIIKHEYVEELYPRFRLGEMVSANVPTVLRWMTQGDTGWRTKLLPELSPLRILERGFTPDQHLWYVEDVEGQTGWVTDAEVSNGEDTFVPFTVTRDLATHARMFPSHASQAVQLPADVLVISLTCTRPSGNTVTTTGWCYAYDPRTFWQPELSGGWVDMSTVDPNSWRDFWTGKSPG